MRCQDLMQRDIFYCRTSDPIYRVAELMAAEGVGFLPVLDHLKRMVGVVTDRDLTTRALARRFDPMIPVEMVMTHQVIACKALDPLERAERKMAESQVSRMPVVDDFGECQGLISLSDIAQVTEPAEAGRVLRRVSERESAEWQEEEETDEALSTMESGGIEMPAPH